MEWAELAPDLSAGPCPRTGRRTARRTWFTWRRWRGTSSPACHGWADSPYVLCTGRGPIAAYDRVKKAIDAAIVRERQEIGEPPEPLAPWWFHDIRRSGVTWMAGAGIAPHVADRLLNHVGGTISGVAAVYQRYQFLPERKAALEAWARHLLGCATGRPLAGTWWPCGTEPVVPVSIPLAEEGWLAAAHRLAAEQKRPEVNTGAGQAAGGLGRRRRASTTARPYRQALLRDLWPTWDACGRRSLDVPHEPIGWPDQECHQIKLGKGGPRSRTRAAASILTSTCGLDQRSLWRRMRRCRPSISPNNQNNPTRLAVSGKACGPCRTSWNGAGRRASRCATEWAQAATLLAWLGDAWPKAPVPKAGSVTNAIRGRFKEMTAAE